MCYCLLWAADCLLLLLERQSRTVVPAVPRFNACPWDGPLYLHWIHWYLETVLCTPQVLHKCTTDEDTLIHNLLRRFYLTHKAVHRCLEDCTGTSKMNAASLPEEMITTIATFFPDARSVCQWASVSRAFYRTVMCHNDALWKTL
jgi:hypothetical protein